MTEQNPEVNSDQEQMDEKERRRIEQTLEELPKGVLGPIDLLADGLALMLGDRIAMAMRNKGNVENIIYQLAIATKTITTLANMLEIRLGNELVEPSDNFNEWNVRRLKLLATMMTSFVEQNVREKDNANEAAASAIDKLNAHISLTLEVETKSNEVVSIAEGKIDLLNEQVKTLNRLLTSFYDQECFIVARIDSITKKPVSFFIDDGDEIRQTTKFIKASRIASKNKARSFRSDVISSLFSRANKLEAFHIHDEVVIMQVSVSQIPILEFEDTP